MPKKFNVIKGRKIFKEITLTNYGAQPALNNLNFFVPHLETKRTKYVVTENRRVFNSENFLIVSVQRKHAMQQKYPDAFNHIQSKD